MGYTRYWNAIDAKDLSSRDVVEFVKMAQRAADIAKVKYGLEIAVKRSNGQQMNVFQAQKQFGIYKIVDVCYNVDE